MLLVRFKPHTTRGDLITRYPTAHGLLPVGSPEATIDQLATAAEIPVAVVMEMLARSCTPVRPNVSVTDWTEESLSDLIDYLQLDHHPYLIAELDRLEWLLQLDGACSTQLIGRMRAWIAGKQSHMQQEEKVLFPLCRELSGIGSKDSPTDQALRQMFASHEQAGAMLLQLCEAFAQELKAGIADPAIRDLLTGLIEVLDLHVELEDTVLLPAVLFEAELQRTRRLRQSLRVLTED
jgi:iron-sulfur cluster repair protein YtfE (RIC family)